MRVRFKGYAPEKRGNRTLHRVRVKGDKSHRVTIPVGPDDPDFSAHYHAARRGEKLPHREPVAPPATSLRALVNAYLEGLAQDVENGTRSALTLQGHTRLLLKACAFPDDTGRGQMGDLHYDLPPAAIRHIIAQWGGKTGSADNTRKALSAAYDRMKWTDANPVAGIGKVHTSRGGAKPWAVDDVRRFLDCHALGTTPRVWLMLALFSGARLSDLVALGRGNEVKRGGVTWLEWQPGKKGSNFTSMPMAPQLREAIQATGVIGPTYLLTAKGQPFASGPSLAEQVRRWTRAAGLEARSSHGLRKALGGLLASAGATEHQIMSVLSHASPTTSSIYTKSADRQRAAAAAMASIGGLDFG